MKITSLRLLDAIFLLLIVAHCYIAPFSKVEESFNLQAIHDLLEYGPFDLSKFDHQVFPGAVKRTFVGAGLLSLLVKPFTYIIYPYHSLIVYQFLVRIALGLINGLSIIKIRTTLERISRNKSLALYFALLQYTQFHIVYYSSRTLPNFIALPFVNYALASILEGKFNGALICLSFVSVVFRAEIGIFTLSIAFISMFSYQLPYSAVPISLIKGGIMGGITTLTVDSYFWGTFPCMPEVSSVLFNVIGGNSKLWGVEPFDAYFTKYFLNIFCPPTVLMLLIPGLFYKNTSTRSNFIRTIGLGSLLFVVLLSFQPHKEWRFIVYAIPGLNLLAANGAEVFKRYSKVASIVKIILVGSSLLSLILSSMMLYVSSLNYPGGAAISSFNDMVKAIDIDFDEDTLEKQNVVVHMDIPACMTGITLFTRIREGSLNHLNVIYDKQENKSLLSDEATWRSFDYVITDLDNSQLSSYKEKDVDTKLYSDGDFKWNKIEAIKGFSRMDVYPIVAVIRNYHLAFRLIKDTMRMDFKMAIDLLNGVVIQKEALYIYSREDY